MSSQQKHVGPAHMVKRSARLAQRMFEERMLVITVDDSRLHRFNETGSFIWQCLETPCSVSELCERVAGHFDGCTKEEAAKDVLYFIETLEKKKLVETME